MINPKQTIRVENVPRSTRLWPKIAGIFGIAFATVLMLFVAYEVFAALVERSAATDQASGQPQPVVIDQNLATELSKVLVLEENPDLSDVKDPFSDRGGLSSTVATTSGSSGSTATQTSASTTGSQSSARAFSSHIDVGGHVVRVRADETSTCLVRDPTGPPHAAPCNTCRRPRTLRLPPEWSCE